MNNPFTACLIWPFFLLIAAFLGDFLVGYNLEIWFGYEAWKEVNLFIRLLLGLITVKFGIFFGAVGFITVLITEAPIFP